ncbi:MAG TPA: hypothetical protein VK509_20855 [Polyangiales bacterium]|nr:hypothetical protein [Polyangiales bacterium]
MRGRWSRLVVAAVLVLALGWLWLLRQRTARLEGELTRARAHAAKLDAALDAQRRPPSLPLPPAQATAVQRPVASPGTAGGSLRYIAIGGGAFPESSEVSLEQNLALAQQVLRGPGLLLFAGGPGSFSVRTQLDDEAPGDDLLQRLGDLFLPRSGRRSRYRGSELAAGPATRSEVEAQLSAALRAGGEPLLVLIATHGDQGEQPADNRALLWGGDALTPARLAELHEAAPRPLRLLVASCFSGGFAELAFAHADERAGVTEAPRCGLFAGTWDRETSGCDPDPERRNQEGYSLHVLQALRARDRTGAPLPLRDLDYDGDGRVSLLEAHAWATIAGQSIDVPTTTSERYLRAVQAQPGRALPALLPEHVAVVARLSARLGLVDDAAARARWQALDKRLAELDQRVSEAEDEVDAAYGALASSLLGRWPVLDDPYHGEFAGLLAREHAAIDGALRDSAEARAYGAADDALAELENARGELEVEEAVVLRLVRAHETLRLAGALQARGGPRWAAYQRLLACERFSP